MIRGNIIDNKKVILKDELLKILPKTENASIAVGYFFVSGFAAIIQSLKNTNKVRLLISNTTDKTTAETLIEGFHNIKQTITEVDKNNFINNDRKIEVISDSKRNIKQSLEHMSQTIDDKTVVEVLIDMMKSKRLEVRVYSKEKLHAKAYIFEPKDTDFAQGMGIVGSSNLSLAGISQNSELNLKTYNAPDVKHLLEWFDTLWLDGLEFTEDFNLILEQSWAGTIYSPYQLFLKASYLEYKDKIDEQHKLDPIWGTTFPKLFQFQKNAVDHGLTMFELYGGVIIGDVVGLGKTYVGTALLKHLQLQEYRPLIICPPQLVSMWYSFCTDYEVDAKILSRGKLSQENFKLFQDYRYKDRDLVLIDESHHFRNNASQQYENLHQFMQARDAKAILLTATPFSNNEKDIKNQIMLFHYSPRTFIPPANETDLDQYFIQVKNGYADLTDLLKNIMIRRTRRYVLKQWGKTDKKGRKYLQVGSENKYFPDRKMKTNRYDINKVYQKKYRKIISYLEEGKLKFARYSVGLYLQEEYEDVELYKDLGVAGEKLVGLIKTILLKRMESSIYAFQESIKNYINTHKIFLELLEEKIIPIGDISYKSMYDIAQSDPDSIYDPETIDAFRKKIKESGETKYKYEAFRIQDLKDAIMDDIEIFEQINELIHGITYETDDKLQVLQKILDKDYLGKKVLVFTEFSVTAKYLMDNIKWNGNKEQVDSTSKNIIECARRFDPINNPGISEKPKKEDEISLLITTDVLSEGVNLQAGEIVINYDFHWNPTRLIQRAGRVDRIGSKNDSIVIHNFLLDPEMERDLHLEYSVDSKINNIQRIIGEDYKILKEDEKINTADIYAIYKEDVSLLDRQDNNPLEPTKFEEILRKIQINEPEFWEEFKKIPDGIRSSSSVKSGGQVLLACEIGTEKSGRLRKYYLIDLKEIKEITVQNAMKKLESNDREVYTIPANYDELISIGWKKFIDDAEQVMARTSSVKLRATQKWVVEKLMKMAKTKEFINEREEIDILRKAFSVPITRGKLNRELLKIKKSDMNYSELKINLSDLYMHFDLQKQVQRNDEESKSPRILYSRYIYE